MSDLRTVRKVETCILELLSTEISEAVPLKDTTFRRTGHIDCLVLSAARLLNPSLGFNVCAAEGGSIGALAFRLSVQARFPPSERLYSTKITG